MKIHAPALALGLSLLCNICPQLATAADGAAASGSPASGATAIDTKADAILHKMSDFYAGLKTYHGTLSREAQGAEKSMNYKIEAEKPAKLSIHISGGNERFEGGQAKMNGEKLYLYNPMIGYVKSKATGNYEELVRDREFQFATAYVFHGQNFLEALLTENPYQFLMQHYGITGGSLVGEEKMEGTAADHLRLTSHRMSYDVWIAQGKPWVLRVWPDQEKLKKAGKTVVFDYHNQSDSKSATAADFAFAAPSEAKEVETFFAQATEPKKQATEPSAPPATEGGPHHPLLNKPAPQLTLDTIGGGTLDLASLKSKNVVVLDFWATWCPPCRAALPILAEVTKSYEDKGVKFFAVDLREDKSKIQDFLKAQGLNINVALDKDGSAAEKYGVEGIPQSVIIGKDGIVRVVHVGFSPSLKSTLPGELDRVLAQ